MNETQPVIPASSSPPAVSVPVVHLPPLPLKLSAGLIITDARGVDIAASMSPSDTLHGEKCFGLRKQYMTALVESANSHAALLAKVSALEKTLEGVIKDTGIARYVATIEDAPQDMTDDYDARTAQAVEAARAALSLPSS